MKHQLGIDLPSELSMSENGKCETCCLWLPNGSPLRFGYCILNDFGYKRYSQSCEKYIFNNDAHLYYFLKFLKPDLPAKSIREMSHYNESIVEFTLF